MSTTPPPSSKPQRVLACMLCQQRKIRCDRNFPCGNCTKHQLRCVPATQTRQRKRRFPERELLERLRRYEELMRRNNVRFEPLHGDGVDKSPKAGICSDVEAVESPATMSSRPESVCETRSIWEATDLGSVHDKAREDAIKIACDQLYDSDDHILFGSRKTTVDLVTLHPEPAHLFRLWQIYLENANPLLKVTHTPSLQPRIIDAASNMSNISPALEALMFSIYSLAIFTLSDQDCLTMFNWDKKSLLSKYHFGCQQALMNCGFLRSGDRESLTALYFYLVSARSNTHPRSLSSMLGIAIRTAQRIGIHDESALAKMTVFDAEMSRRLWWSFVLFDCRISEMAQHRCTALTPTWDCKMPLNVNDFDLWKDMKETPVPGRATEAVLAVVRSELGEFMRHSCFYLDFSNPALKPLAKDLGTLSDLEKRLEEDYLKFCDAQNALHFLTIWTTRTLIYKCRLLDHYSKYPTNSSGQTALQREAAMFHAFGMLECDTKLMESRNIKGYAWILELHFPFPAYMHIVQELKRQPTNRLADKAWEVMACNYKARFDAAELIHGSPLFSIFASSILHAWDSVEAALRELGRSVASPPKVVSSIRQRVSTMSQSAQKNSAAQVEGGASTEKDGFLPTPMGTSSSANDVVGGMEGLEGGYFDMAGQPFFNLDISQLSWPGFNWT